MPHNTMSDIAAGRHIKVKPLAEVMNVSAQALYDALSRREIVSVRVGKSIRIPAYEASRLLGLPATTVHSPMQAA